MIVDASALVALLLREPAAPRIAVALAEAPWAAVGAPTLTEAAIVAAARGVPPTALPALLVEAGIDVLPYTHEHATVAAHAYRVYGRSRHPAGLNFGDCMVYAMAKVADAPLLFVGEDFPKTDLRAALA